MKSLRKCVKCGLYTMNDANVKCTNAKCGGETRAAHPPKYSPVDKYASYRRKEKYG